MEPLGSGLLSEPRRVIPLTSAADAEISRLLHDARVTFDPSLPENRGFSVQLSGKASEVLVVLRHEGNCKSYGFTIEARPMNERSSAFDLRKFEIEVLQISADDQSPVGSLSRNAHRLACGPFEPDKNYIIQVLRPPQVIAERFRPKAGPPVGSEEWGDLKFPRVGSEAEGEDSDLLVCSPTMQQKVG